MYLGIGFAMSTREGWLRSVAIPWNTGRPISASTVAAAGSMALAVAPYALYSTMILSRVRVEDAILRKRFGKQWDD
jgi:protein-S-isoprenylcysteine O-methyltransferase Ste14